MKLIGDITKDLVHLPTEARAVAVAVEAKKIKDFTTKEEVDGLLMFCAQWRTGMGFYASADTTQELQAELVQAVNHIRRIHAEHSIQELQVAVDLLYQAKIKVDYTRFRGLVPIFISQVINAYKDYKREQMRIIINFENQQRAEANKLVMTDEEAKKSQLENLKRVWNCVLSQEKFHDYGYVVYEWITQRPEYVISKEVELEFTYQAKATAKGIVASRESAYRVSMVKTGKCDRESDFEYEFKKAFKTLITEHFIKNNPTLLEKL